MSYADRFKDSLPPEARRRLGRIKRAVLDQPEQPVIKTVEKVIEVPTIVEKLVSIPTPSITDQPGTLPREERTALRQKLALLDRPRDSSILEIGPAHNPTCAKKDGFNTKNTDYLDREGLVDKYKDHPYDPNDIEEVDYVLEAGAEMADLIPERFDIVLASHVIEHSLSLIDFLNECARLLASDGRIALVVPDCRYTFDRFRGRSTLARVIDAAAAPRSFHSPGTMAEFSLNAVKHRGTTSWAPGHRGDYSWVNSIDQVKSNIKRAEAQNGYIDMHNWVFTPHHLRLMVHDLATLGYIDLWEESWAPTQGHEFFLNLSPSGKGIQMSREELVVLADAELRALDTPTWEPTA
jgi:SAM-dependent methyltransferase